LPSQNSRNRKGNAAIQDQPEDRDLGLYRHAEAGETYTPPSVRGSVIEMKHVLPSSWRHFVLFAAIIALGLFARVWEYRSLPPGLNQDDASNGVDAMSLYRYGTDRTGVPFPIRFVSWGSGQDALYGYMLVPLIAVAGLSPTVVRLPMLFVSILSLPLVYFIGRKLRGPDFGILAMFLLAISPWHIILSRRALEANLLPFLFMLGFACLLMVDVNNHWFVAACLILGIALYSYITSYLLIPFFLLLAIPTLYIGRRVSVGDILGSTLLLAVLALPVVIYVIINSLGLPSVRLGPLTVPRLPSVSRISTDVAIFQPGPVQQLARSAKGFLYMLVFQLDGTFNNSGQGYMYRFTFPLILVGGWFVFRRPMDRVARRLFMSWLLAALAVGVLVSPVFVHNNVLIVALILLCAGFLEWMLIWKKIVFVLFVGLFLAAFLSFTLYYHSPDSIAQVQRDYHADFLPALDYARTSTSGPICVIDDKIVMPYIFVLFSEKMAPDVGPDKIIYADSTSQYRNVTSVGRYFFGPDYCPASLSTTYVMLFNEQAPVRLKAFEMTRFGLYKVLVPRK
jgi:hypothetical protein